MQKLILIFLTFGLFFAGLCAQSTPIFLMEKGQVFFSSDAPLELIEASSNELRGLLDPDKSTFAFTIPIASFEGFNSPLQQVHFHENYLESDKYPAATFLGKVIENVDLNQEGDYVIRAKGKLTIHGVERERIIKVKLTVKGKVIDVDSEFTVLLREHDVSIPRIVFQKIAEEISVRITGELKKRPE